VRIQVLTNAGALDRAKQLAVVEQLTRIAADAAGDPTLASRTWVLLTEAPDGGWGLDGHANTNQELVAAARAQPGDAGNVVLTRATAKNPPKVRNTLLALGHRFRAQSRKPASWQPRTHRSLEARGAGT
jgi:phenylpyruvate tautomerase PptA (4-oxalocrotonate tautomerase family)